MEQIFNKAFVLNRLAEWNSLMCLFGHVNVSVVLVYFILDVLKLFALSVKEQLSNNMFVPSRYAGLKIKVRATFLFH